MGETTTIVTAADSGYFDLLTGLISSIHAHRPDDAIKLSVLDVGLESAQVEQLHAIGCSVVEPKWDFDFPQRPEKPQWYRAMTSRCFLPEYFPGHELYVWIDSDAWLQDWRAVDLLVRAGMRFGLAVVPEIDRSYEHIFRFGVFNHNGVYKSYEKSYGTEIAKGLSMLPVINSGVFSMRAEHPCWKSWAKWLGNGLQNRAHKLSEQCALNAAIYADHHSMHVLPAWCNWVCGQRLPTFDVSRKCLCEAMMPYERLSIVHPTPDPRGRVSVPTTDGEQIEVGLEYASFQKMIV